MIKDLSAPSLGMTPSELTRALCLIPPATSHAPVTFIYRSNNANARHTATLTTSHFT